VSGDNIFCLTFCMQKMKLGCVQLLMEIYSDLSLETVLWLEMTRKHCIVPFDIIKWSYDNIYPIEVHTKFTYEAMKHHSI